MTAKRMQNSGEKSGRKNLSLFTFPVLVSLAGGLINLISGVQPAAAHSPEVVELLRVGDSDMEQGKLTDAAQAYRQAIKLEPHSPDAHNQLGLCYSRQNMLLEASGEFRKALDEDSRFLPSLINLGTVMYRHGSYDQAINYYQKALASKDGHDAELNTDLGSVFRDRATFAGGPTREEDFKQAVRHYEQALEDDPKFPQAHNNLGLCLLRLRKFDDAEREIQQAIDLKQDYAAAYFNLGLVEQARNRLPEAVTAFQNSLRYETVPAYIDSTRQHLKELGLPTSGDDHFSRGYDLLSQHKWAESESEFRKVTSSPTGAKNAIAWNNLAFVQAKQAHYRDAISAYKKASSLLPGRFPAAWYNLGQTLRTTGDLEGAEEAFKHAVSEAHGTHALAHNALGMVLKQKGDVKGAQAEYRLAIMQSGDTLPVVHYNLGLLLEKDPGRQKDAADQFSHYLIQAPDGLNAANARVKLKRLGH